MESSERERSVMERGERFEIEAIWVTGILYLRKRRINQISKKNTPSTNRGTPLAWLVVFVS